ncbi:hypothetical protein GM658_28480 [Pseudoduganella eburnea]|uniref:Esterase n=1 Tax=Massilia eburnea TaxID=1776165 RepID=A0A6L6QRP1_9BURK|nr:hypothetical protein [Massilia eburnea]MTW14557.1 hypothetical protein [Massilia eburnea]
MLAISLLTCFSTAVAEDFVPQDLKICESSSSEKLCKEPLLNFEIAEMQQKLVSKKLEYRIEKDALIVMLEANPGEITSYGRPYLCCEIQAYLDKVIDNKYAAKFRWKQLARANVDLSFLNIESEQTTFRINGDTQFPMAERKLKKSIIADAGMSQSENSYVINDDMGARNVTVVKGPACRLHLTGCTIIYMPDGEGVAELIGNALTNHIDLSHFVFVGVHTMVDGSNIRIEELLFGYESTKFRAFMKFVTFDLRQKIENGERPAYRYSAGYSNGGAWALDALTENPNLFDGAIAMSPAQWTFRDTGDFSKKKVFIGAGMLETRFHKAAQSYTEGLKLRGMAVEEIYVPSGHGINTWLNIWNGALMAIQSTN